MELGLNLGLGTGGGLRLPPGVISLIRDLGGVLTDTIGELISRSQVDEVYADVFFDGEIRRSDEDIFLLAFENPWLNVDKMIGKEGVFLALYSIETSDAVLLKALRLAGVRSEQVYISGEDTYLDGSAVYIGATA